MGFYLPLPQPKVNMTAARVVVQFEGNIGFMVDQLRQRPSC
jgi:hypothetical protein